MNLRFSIYGDSISTFEGYTPSGNRVYYEYPQTEITNVLTVDDTWWMQVIRHFGGTLHSNAAFSGGMVEGAGFPAGESMERIAQIGERWEAPNAGHRDDDGAKGPVESETPDVILVFMGINDYGWGGSMAQAAGRSAAAPPCLDVDEIPPAVAGMADESSLSHFAAAYERMLLRIRSLYPDAEVWCLTLPPGRERGLDHSAFCYSLRGIDLDSYNEAIRSAALLTHCHVADIRALNRDYETSDGTHPTKRGMRQLAEMVIRSMYESIARDSGRPCPDVEGFDGKNQDSWLFDSRHSCTPENRPRISILERSEAPTQPLDAPASIRYCFKPSCVGCEYARGTGNTWSCVCERPLGQERR